jgi:hypothetical protein
VVSSRHLLYKGRHSNDRSFCSKSHPEQLALRSERLQQPQNEIILAKFFSFLNNKYRVEQGLPIKVGVALTVLDIFAESPKSCVWNCDELRGQNLRPFLQCVQ